MKRLGRFFLLTVGILGFHSCSSLSDHLPTQVAQLKQDSLQGGLSEQKPISEADLAGLPAIVQKYFAYSGCLGKTPPQTIRLKQIGRMKTEVNGEWMPFTAEEYYSVAPKAFVWLGRIHKGPMEVQGLDQYSGGHGSLTIKMGPWFQIGKSEGPPSDLSEFIRFFNEMTWFPAAMLDKALTWESLSDLKVRATLEDHGIQASAVLTFQPDGALTNWETDQRFALIDGKPVPAHWSTPFSPREFIIVGGTRVSAAGSAVYDLPSGPYSYIELKVTELEYDPPELLYR